MVVAILAPSAVRELQGLLSTGLMIAVFLVEMILLGVFLTLARNAFLALPAHEAVVLMAAGGALVCAASGIVPAQLGYATLLISTVVLILHLGSIVIRQSLGWCLVQGPQRATESSARVAAMTSR